MGIAVKIPTYNKTVYEPNDLNGHKNDSDMFLWHTSLEVNHHSSPPTITHGDKAGWTNYSRLTTARSVGGDGIYSKTIELGHVFLGWGSSGSKHSEIFSVGGNEGRWARTGTSTSSGVTGFGFEMKVHRTDSTSSDNNNASQHCIFLKRYGLELRDRTSTSQSRFWSTPVIASNGAFSGGTVSGGTVYRWDFHKQTRSGGWGYNCAGANWVPYRMWFNFASRDGSWSGTATTEIKIFNWRFYYNYGSYSQGRLVRPAMRALSQANKRTFN